MRFYIALLSCFFSTISQGEPLLTWYAYNQPPAYIFEGNYKGLGFANLTQQLVINALPQYKHVEIQVSVGRAMHDMQLKKNVCVFGIYPTTQRKEHVWFSNDALMNRNVHILIKKSKADALQLLPEVEFDSLFKVHKLSTHVISGRFYGKTIDKILKDYPAQVSKQATNSDSALYSMLNKGRFDFLLTYPSSANYAMETGLISANYVLIKIKDIPPFIKAGVGCSKTAWGKKIISEVNQALKKVKGTQVYFNSLSSWSRGSSDEENFKQFYRNQFLP